jgi:hypothetical protein
MVLAQPPDGSFIQVTIENGFADNWQNEPYKSDLIRWSSVVRMEIVDRSNHRAITIVDGRIFVQENVNWVDETSLDLLPSSKKEIAELLRKNMQSIMKTENFLPT